ncbi:MAG: hypothetical protein ABIQ09_14400 [Jatrophihabitantaceae bacterium]
MAVSAAGLVAGGIVAMAGAAPAAALPTGCSINDTTYSASATCSSGTGQFRIVTTCENYLGARSTQYGAWVGAGNTSVVNCPFTNGLQGYSISSFIDKR